jgi:hypothetical protein
MLKVISGRKKTTGMNKNRQVGRVVPSIALGASSRIRNLQFIENPYCLKSKPYRRLAGP